MRPTRYGGAARSSRGTATTLRRGLASVAGLVFGVAMLNGLAWAFLTPPFQVPDETAHFAYAQGVAENGFRAGVAGRPEFSSEQTEAMATMGTLNIIGRPLVRVPSDSPSVDAALEKTSATAARGDGGGPSSASSQPPLYYLLAAAPYKAFASATLPTRLHAMRVLSVVLFAMGAAFAALFVAELLPGRAWAPLVGGSAIALSPYGGHIASGVTPDTLLMAASAATLLAVARIFRRGMSRRRAVVLGLVVGVGAVTKLTFLAFVPPALACLLFAAFRDRRALARYRGGALAAIGAGLAAAAVLPVASLLALHLTSPAGAASGRVLAVAVGPGGATNVREIGVYAWELFLPRLPFMERQFSYSPLLSTWIDGFAGRYGWLDYSAPAWVATTFRWCAATCGVLLALAAATSWRTCRARRAELAAYTLFFVALAAVIAKTGYDYRRATGFVFEQPRYLLGLSAFYAAAVAGACLGLGRRRAPSLAVLAIIGFCVHDLTGLAMTTIRYYG